MSIESPKQCPACGFKGKPSIHPPGAWMWGAKCLECGELWWEHRIAELETRVEELEREKDVTCFIPPDNPHDAWRNGYTAGFNRGKWEEWKHGMAPPSDNPYLEDGSGG